MALITLAALTVLSTDLCGQKNLCLASLAATRLLVILHIGCFVVFLCSMQYSSIAPRLRRQFEFNGGALQSAGCAVQNLSQ